MASGGFDIDSLAQYLHLNVTKVRRLADRGKLPGRKVSGEWYFVEAEVNLWLEEQIGASNETELVHVENALQKAVRANDDVCIADALPREAVMFPLKSRTRTSVISKMVQVAAATGWLWDPEKMAAAVADRESLHSTALDNGVALLHPRRPHPNILAQNFLALGRTLQGIPFGGSHGQLTDVFFLILSTDDRGHLRTLARLSRLIQQTQLVSAIRDAENSQQMHAVIEECETSYFG